MFTLSTWTCDFKLPPRPTTPSKKLYNPKMSPNREKSFLNPKTVLATLGMFAFASKTVLAAAYAEEDAKPSSTSLYVEEDYPSSTNQYPEEDHPGSIYVSSTSLYPEEDAPDLKVSSTNMYEEEEYPVVQAEVIEEVDMSNELLFSEDVNILKIDFNAPELRVDHIATAPVKECSPQYSRDKKQIYLSGTDEIKVYNLENGSVSDLTFPNLYIKGEFLLLKPNLNELVYVSGYGGEYNIRHHNISNPSETKTISPHKCKPRYAIELIEQFSNGSKILYRCGPTGREVFLKDLDDTNSEAEDVLVARYDSSMARLTISPDNRRIITCSNMHSHCTLYDITNPLQVTSRKIPLPTMPPGLIHFAFSDDRRILYILASNGMKESDKYKLFRLNYEEIVNNPGQKSYIIGEVTRLEKPENFVCSRKSLLKQKN